MSSFIFATYTWTSSFVQGVGLPYLVSSHKAQPSSPASQCIILILPSSLYTLFLAHGPTGNLYSCSCTSTKPAFLMRAIKVSMVSSLRQLRSPQLRNCGPQDAMLLSAGRVSSSQRTRTSPSTCSIQPPGSIFLCIMLTVSVCLAIG